MPLLSGQAILTIVPTRESAAMERVVVANARLLKEAGFRKRRHSFNRITADGLVHVVFFWMAPKEPPAWTEVPGLRERLYGNFRLDFGVHVPEMQRMGVPKSDWINTYNCHLRRTIGQLMTGDDRSDLWWSLEDEQADAIAQMALQERGLPWLDQFPDHDAVFERFKSVGPLDLGMGPAGDLDIAEMLMSRGRLADARRILEAFVDRPVRRPHAEYLAEYLPTIGHEDLVPRIRSVPEVALQK
jgi:hypothetical protein